MEFKYRTTGGNTSNYNPRPPPHSSSDLSYFAQQALRVGYTRPGLARAGDYFPNPNNMPESVLREREKQQIREEIIAAEVERRRQLEAEVRREMMMEREMALRGTHAHDFPFFPGPPTMLMSSRLPMLNHSETRFRDASPILNHSETRFRDALPFSRKSEVRITEVKASPEVNKERIILLPKPEGNNSGIKRKATTPPETSVTMPLKDPKKKKQENLRCELCQVSATSDKALKEHFQGKKHKSREARQSSQITGQNFAIGLFSRKPINSQNKVMEVTKDGSSVRDEKLKGGEVSEKKLVEDQKDDVGLQASENPEGIKNDEVATKKKVEKESLKFTFWCQMCKIGAFSEKVMNAHMRGKKHTSLLLESLNSRLGVTAKNENVSLTASEKEVNEVNPDIAGGKLSKKDIAGGSKDGEEMKKPQMEQKENEECRDTDDVLDSSGSGRPVRPLLIGWVE